MRTHRNALQRAALLFSLRYVCKSSDFPSCERMKMRRERARESRERMDGNVCQKTSITQSKHARMCCRMHGAYHAIHNIKAIQSKASSNDFAHHSTALREEKKSVEICSLSPFSSVVAHTCIHIHQHKPLSLTTNSQYQ